MDKMDDMDKMRDDDMNGEGGNVSVVEGGVVAKFADSLEVGCNIFTDAANSSGQEAMTPQIAPPATAATAATTATTAAPGEVLSDRPLPLMTTSVPPHTAEDSCSVPRPLSNQPKVGTQSSSKTMTGANDRTQERAQSSPQVISSVEGELRIQLLAAHELIAAQSEELEELTQALSQERILVRDYADAMRAHADYAQQNSRLVRVFRALNVPLPDLTGEEFDADAVVLSVRNRMLEEDELNLNEATQLCKTVTDCFQILTGAREMVPGDSANTMKLVFHNDNLERDMSFWLQWDNSNVTYRQISMNIPSETKPSFVTEGIIHFNVTQGPNFLLQILNSMYINRPSNVDPAEQMDEPPEELSHQPPDEVSNEPPDGVSNEPPDEVSNGPPDELSNELSKGPPNELLGETEDTSTVKSI